MASPHTILERDEFRTLDQLARTDFRAWSIAHERDGKLPIENLTRIHELGLLHAAATSGNGGRDGSLLGRDPGVFLQAVRTIARGDSSTAHCYQVHNHTLWLLEELGTPQQRERFLQPLTSKFSLLASVGSEPGRTNMYVMQTKAKRVDGGWRLNGVKNFATNGPLADYIVAFVAIDGVDDYFKNHMMVILEPDMPGITLSDDWYQPHGMRAARSSVITLQDVFVPDSHVLGEPGSYPKGRWQGRYHLGFAANYLGASEGLYGWYLDYIKGRGRATNAITQLRTGEMRITLDSAAALFNVAIESWQKSDVVASELISMSAKSAAAHAAFKLTQTVVHASGATAQFDEHPLGRYIRDLETHVLHAGHDRTAQILGQAELGEQFDSTLQR
jgi:alkylation response protein AidB-like acyl-CoA dehydrogenase